MSYNGTSPFYATLLQHHVSHSPATLTHARTHAVPAATRAAGVPPHRVGGPDRIDERRPHEPRPRRVRDPGAALAAGRASAGSGTRPLGSQLAEPEIGRASCRERVYVRTVGKAPRR